MRDSTLMKLLTELESFEVLGGPFESMSKEAREAFEEARATQDAANETLDRAQLCIGRMRRAKRALSSETTKVVPAPTKTVLVFEGEEHELRPANATEPVEIVVKSETPPVEVTVQGKKQKKGGK